jgi:hypothetical protein
MSGSDQAGAVDGDILIGAAAILPVLRELGVIEEANEDEAEDEAKYLDKIYYLAKSQKLPIGKFGKSLIASRTKLRRAVLSLVS